MAERVNLAELLEELKNAARREDWATVDAKVGGLHNVVGDTWAFGEGLDDPDPNIRDLAATILGAHALDFTDKEREKLFAKVKTDESLVVRARCAFALVVQNYRISPIVETIDEARKSDDAELAKVAQSYWERYVQPHARQ